VIGDTAAPVKAVVAMDGRIERSDGSDSQPASSSSKVRTQLPGPPTFGTRSDYITNTGSGQTQ
jgi:hypothetical protein